MNEIFGLPANTLLYILLGLTALIALGTLFTALRYPLAFRLGIRNLPRRKSQTGLIVAGLALSTLIITSALGIGDTVDYSVKSGVYADLGAIDAQIGASAVEAQSGFSLGSSAPLQSGAAGEWFDESAAATVAGLVDGELLDGSAAALVQALPVVNDASGLSEAAAEVRGLGTPAGDGFAAGSAALAGLSSLEEGQVLVNASLARSLEAGPGDTLLVIKGMAKSYEIAAVVPDGGLAGANPALILPLERAQTLFGQPGEITAIFVSHAGDAEQGAALSEPARERLTEALPELVVSPVKADQIAAAETSAGFITTLFVTFGTFSIVSGILLIFLIFTVLAAERRSELGMSRAVGLQRADLVRQFVTEGLAYDFMAALVGATLGVAAALLLAGAITNLLGGGLELTARVSPRSVAIGYTLGVVITFITVSIAAVQISKVNIIAAIRDLNLPVPPRVPQWTLFLHPFLVWRAALQQAGQGQVRAALRLFLLAGPKAILNFWAGLLARGPVLLALGWLLAWVGVNQAGQAGVYSLGVSLFLIGAGQLLHWLGLPARWSYSLIGLSLVLYWSLPVRNVGRLAELENSQGDFFISGMFLVGGAITLFLYNADRLLGLFAGLLSRLGNLLPVARVAIAYPVAAKGRTATTLAMFSLIIFTLVSTATITNTFTNFLDVESGSGGYDLLVQSNPFNPVPATQFTEKVAELVESGEIPAPEALAASIFAPVEAQSADMTKMASYVINGVDEDFFTSQRLELSGIAEGYGSPEEVWAALQNDPALIVVDGFSVDRSGDPTYQRSDEAFSITSIRASDTTFKPTRVTISAKDGTPREFTVIGALGSAPAFYGALMNQAAAESLGYSAANRYFMRLPEGSDAEAAGNRIEAAFGRSGLQTTLLKAQLEESRRSINSIFYLIQGFIGLGLLIGIAALGVITIRAVVERRQQIGVLRAIGFQRDMVQKVFLFESLFIAGLGVVIGYGLALTFAYNLYLQVAADQGLPFLPPWGVLALIGALIFVSSLVTAWLPARGTANVVIAEALRYE